MHSLCCPLRHARVQLLTFGALTSLVQSPALARCPVRNGGKALSCAPLLSIDRKLVSEESRTVEQTAERDLAHVPVLLTEVVAHFANRRLLSLVDCTLGAGGHAAAIISSHPEMDTFVGMDVDPVAHVEAYPRLQDAIKSRTPFPSGLELNIVMTHTNFRNIKNALKDQHPMLTNRGVDGILMDLGMSSMQVNQPDRGFSFMREGPVDMRMDPTASLNAEEILNTWPEVEIGRILQDFGEERRWKYLARKIVEERLAGGIKTTSQLVKIIGGSSFRRTKGKHGRLKQAMHPATRTFQALRIAVNDELASLELALADAYNCLAPGGRLQVISFHSLEDRIVKQFFLKVSALQSTSCEDEKENPKAIQGYQHMPGETRHNIYIKKKSFQSEMGRNLDSSKLLVEGEDAIILTRRPIIPSDAEMNFNPRSRSAKLRVIEKK